MTAGGITTEPEYRRGGYVREILNRSFEMSKDHGAVVSMLHPFSFGYYRKFGYDCICDHLILEFPISKLEFVERNPNLVRYEGGEVSDRAWSFQTRGRGWTRGCARVVRGRVWRR